MVSQVGYMTFEYTAAKGFNPWLITRVVIAAIIAGIKGSSS